MDAKFLPAQAAIRADQPEELEQLIRADSTLATDRSLSAGDHPTLLCCLVLEMPARRELDRLIRLFSEQGAELTEALTAAASINNTTAITTLLDLGVPIAGDRSWSPLDEALYWGHADSVEFLVKHGAPIDNIRKYAALGHLDGIRRCFGDAGLIVETAGEVDWPFGNSIEPTIRSDPQQITNHALIYACAWGQLDSANELITHGAEINAIPAGFDFAGTPLHYAALNNRREMVEWLLSQGADPTIRDTKVQNTPDGWADYARHRQLAQLLHTARETWPTSHRNEMKFAP
ncbi:ankyrin repeat domain-containing protein [Schlesneria sp. DSM 10557]|uniref:ankyrin repeat domain-containing protein n=1 Tax=Schlesneria sp. DSM 10557 TaxID=3044399 RepID=UPI00359F4AA0